MIVLDTHALVNDALDPARLSSRARKAINLAAATRLTPRKHTEKVTLTPAS